MRAWPSGPPLRAPSPSIFPSRLLTFHSRFWRGGGALPASHLVAGLSPRDTRGALLTAENAFVVAGRLAAVLKPCNNSIAIHAPRRGESETACVSRPFRAPLDRPALGRWMVFAGRCVAPVSATANQKNEELRQVERSIEEKV